MLVANKNKVKKDPTINVDIVALPEDPGTKNPTTATAKIIFAKSEKNFEIESIWALFSLFGMLKSILAYAHKKEKRTKD